MERISTSVSPPGNKSSPPPKKMNISSSKRPTPATIISPNRFKELELSGEEDEENNVVEVKG